MPPARMFTVRIEGGDEVLRAFKALPPEATKELRTETFKVSELLAVRIQLAARAEGGQGPTAAGAVKAVFDRVPAVVGEGWQRVTGTGGRGKGRKLGSKQKARAVFFGANFGMTRKSGWYRKIRYFDSFGKQFKPWNGGAGSDDYFFFRTAEESQGWMESRWREVAARVVQKWSA